MTSPILYLVGGAVLIGGGWYAFTKWRTASKCLDKATLAALVESTIHGTKTSAEARALADALEKDGCAAEDVKSLRDAANAKDAGVKPACPPVDYATTIANVATMTFESVSSLAATWETAGCATEAKALKDAFSAALKGAVLKPIKKEKASLLTPPPPGYESAPVDGWPKVQALPAEVYAKVYPTVSKVRWNQLWSVEPPTSLTDVCPWGCSSANLIAAWKLLEVQPLGGFGGLTESVRDDAVNELKTAQIRLATKEPVTSGFAGRTDDRAMPPYLRKRVA